MHPPLQRLQGMTARPRRTQHGAYTWFLAALAGVALLAGAPRAGAQSIDPRAYADIPVGVNFVIAGYAYTEGALPNSVPVTNSHLYTSNAVLAYSRSLDLWGMSGKIDANVPFTWLWGSADYKGETATRSIADFGDPAVRLSVNFYGAPALDAKEFASYHQNLVIGGSLQISAPLGQYDSTRVVNIGTNIWTFKPEVGASKAFGHWILELQTALTIYTDNNNFYNGNTRTEDPLYQLQGHVIYSFNPAMWTSIDATYYTGGRTTLDSRINNDLEQDWRVGATFAFPISRYNAIKLYASDGVSARTGNSYKLIGIALQHRWGGGI
jgi:hypothetical protein